MTKLQLIELVNRLPETFKGFLLPMSDGSLETEYMCAVKWAVYQHHRDAYPTKQAACDALGISVRGVLNWKEVPFPPIVPPTTFTYLG
jgi:hypothetical protein